MTLDAMLRAVGRLLTDPASRQAVAQGKEDFTEAEQDALRSIDLRRIDMVAEGFTGKRTERLVSRFPRTMASLATWDASWTSRYLESTPFPAKDQDESNQFLASISLLETELPGTADFLRDLASIEETVAGLDPPSGLPQFRYQPDSTRPSRSPHTARVSCKGPLDEVLNQRLILPTAYALSPRRILVARTMGGMLAEALDARTEALLDSCDGTKTVADLQNLFGPPAGLQVKAWLRQGVLLDHGSKR